MTYRDTCPECIARKLADEAAAKRKPPRHLGPTKREMVFRRVGLLSGILLAYGFTWDALASSRDTGKFITFSIVATVLLIFAFVSMMNWTTVDIGWDEPARPGKK